MRILIVDDEPIICDSVAILLKRIDSDLELTILNDGMAAVVELEREPADAVISDIRMPRLDGMTLAQFIFERWANTQVIFLTGYADFELARAALRSGVVDYLVKPIRFNELKDALNRIHERRSRMEAANANPAEIKDMAEVMREAAAYIRVHYGERLSLKQMGEQFFLNASYFSEQFAYYNQKTFVEYLTEVRMKRARMLLAESDSVPITTIALDVGYEDSRYFSTVFKKEHGMTPSEYRRAVFIT